MSPPPNPTLGGMWEAACPGTTHPSNITSCPSSSLGYACPALRLTLPSSCDKKGLPPLQMEVVYRVFPSCQGRLSLGPYYMQEHETPSLPIVKVIFL